MNQTGFATQSTGGAPAVDGSRRGHDGARRGLRRQAWTLARFAARTVAAIATVRAVDVGIVRLAPGWQFVSITGVAVVTALVDMRPPASVEGHHP